MTDVRHSIPLAVKWSSASQAGEFVGYASTFGGEPDAYGDVVAPGAFAATIAEHKAKGTTPALLWSHDQSQPIGVIAKLTENDHGLLMEGRLTLDVGKAAEAHALMKAGALAFSIGYQTTKSTALGKGIKRLDAVKLYEVSAVAIPANSNAKLVSVKTQPSLIDQHSPRTIEKILRDAGVSWRLAKQIATLGKPALKEREVLLADQPLTKRLIDATRSIQDHLSKKTIMPVEATNLPIEDAIDALAETTTTALGEVKELRNRLEKLEARSKRPGAPANDNFNLKAGGHANDNDAKSDLVEEKKALADYVRHGETKSMSVGSDPDGGYGVTPQLSDQISRRLYDQSHMRQICRVVEVGSFDSFEEPYQIGDTSAVWVGESASRPATATPTLGLLNVPVNEIYASQPVTQRLLDDSRFDMAGFVVERASDRFGRSEGTAFVRGSGVGQPKGFMSYQMDAAADFARASNKLQFVSAGDGIVTFEGLKALYWALRAPYRANASWLMSSVTASQVDRLTDSTGRYLWRDSVAAGLPPTLLGRPVYFDENMDATSQFPVAFGDWTRGYVIADKPGVRWLRDPFTSKPNVLFYAYKRVGGGVADFDAIKVLKIGA